MFFGMVSGKQVGNQARPLTVDGIANGLGFTFNDFLGRGLGVTSNEAGEKTRLRQSLGFKQTGHRVGLHEPENGEARLVQYDRFILPTLPVHPNEVSRERSQVNRFVGGLGRIVLPAKDVHDSACFWAGTEKGFVVLGE